MIKKTRFLGKNYNFFTFSPIYVSLYETLSQHFTSFLRRNIYWNILITNTPNLTAIDTSVFKRHNKMHSQVFFQKAWIGSRPRCIVETRSTCYALEALCFNPIIAVKRIVRYSSTAVPRAEHVERISNMRGNKC